jgi:nucleotide-binding universal stress UspA family protein
VAHTSATVIVAVDAAGSADYAVEWAAAEAGARGLPLHIVHALALPHTVSLDGLDVTTEHSLATRAVAEQVLHDGVASAHSVVADLAVTTEMLHGPACWALEHAGHGAPLLVLGSRGRTALRRFVGGSVSGHLAACAPCPAVIVRHHEQVRGAAPAVVAGVVAGPRGLAAVDFAFQAAWQRRIPLILVHVASENATLNVLTQVPLSVATVGPEAIPDPAIIQAIRSRRRRYPGIDLRIKGPVGDPATILLAESAGAALLVLGSAGGRGRGARDLTSVGQRLLPAARCPVAVVGQDAVSAATVTPQARAHPERPGKTVRHEAN